MTFVTYKNKNNVQYKSAEIYPQPDNGTSSAQWVCV